MGIMFLKTHSIPTEHLQVIQDEALQGEEGVCIQDVSRQIRYKHCSDWFTELGTRNRQRGTIQH